MADAELKPCPFCGGAVELERTTGSYEKMHGQREWWGVVCRNTINVGGTCAIQQVPSASKEAAVERWNCRATHPTEAGAPTSAAECVLPEGFEALHLPHDDSMTAEWNAKNRFIVRRIAAPFCGKDSIRQWAGPTLPAALETACAALGLAPTSGRESAAPGAHQDAPAKSLAHGHRDDYHLLANCRRLMGTKARFRANWVLAGELFATGSNSARQICIDAGIAPDAFTVERK